MHLKVVFTFLDNYVSHVLPFADFLGPLILSVSFVVLGLYGIWPLRPPNVTPPPYKASLPRGPGVLGWPNL